MFGMMEDQRAMTKFKEANECPSWQWTASGVADSGGDSPPGSLWQQAHAHIIRSTYEEKVKTPSVLPKLGPSATPAVASLCLLEPRPRLSQYLNNETPLLWMLTSGLDLFRVCPVTSRTDRLCEFKRLPLVCPKPKRTRPPPPTSTPSCLSCSFSSPVGPRRSLGATLPVSASTSPPPNRGHPELLGIHRTRIV